MPNVKTVQDKGDKAALLILDDGSKPVWTPDRELARTLLGKPIPPDWTVKDGEYGPQALPPRPKGAGGMVAYRNTKEAFDAEAKSRAAWQQVEEEKKDRRTALMQAVQHLDGVAAPPEDALRIAEQMYDWLRESSPAVTPAGEATTETRPRTSPQAGDTTPAASGEVAARPEPGVGSVKTTLGSSTFPLRPEDCTHRAASGRWLPTKQVEGVPICPRCGMSAVLYRESA